MRSRVSVGMAGVLLAVALPGLAATPRPAVDREAVAKFAQDELAKLYPSDGPGAAVLIRLGGEDLLRRGYGLANLDLGVPVSPDHLFEIGSVTKQFTAAAILRLAEAGRLSLDDPIGRFLPDFPTGEATVTLAHLLHHTSGVPSYTEMEEWMPRWREDMTLDTLIGLFRGKPLEFAPGSNWNYSNSGYVLLGAVIEKVSGKSYEAYVEEELLAPLGLARTRYGHQEELAPGRVNGYQKGRDGWQNAPYLSLSQPYAAGSLMSTVDDLARWAEALERGEVVSAAWRDRMFTPAVLAGGEQAGVDTRYGLGIGVGRLGGLAVHEHGGGIHGFVSSLLSMPELDLVIVVLANNTAAGSPSELSRRIAAVAAGQDGAPTPVSLPAEQLDEYTGVYRVPDGGAAPEQRRFVSREGDSLYFLRSGGRRSRIVPLGDDRFAFEDRGTTVRFERGGDGRISGLRVDGQFGPLVFSRRTDEALPVGRQEVAVDPAWLDGLVGTYTLAPGFEIEVMREGDRLFTQATGQQKFEIFAEAENRWFLKVVDAVLVFDRQPGQPAAGLVLHQGGAQMPAPRKQ